MPRKKISLDDISLDQAFQRIQREGIEIEVKGVKREEVFVKSHIEDFIDTPQITTPTPIGKKFVEIDLYATHTVGSGGSLVGDAKQESVVGNSFEQYGPGRRIRVPIDLAQHLLHQDMLARRADDRFLNPQRRTYVVARVRDSTGIKHIGSDVTGQFGDDLSGALAAMGDHQLHIIKG